MSRKTSQRTLLTQSDDYWEGWLHCTLKVNGLQLWTYTTRKCKMSTLFSGHYLRNTSTLDIGVLGYIGII